MAQKLFGLSVLLWCAFKVSLSAFNGALPVPRECETTRPVSAFLSQGT